MNYELVAIIGTIIATGCAIIGLIRPSISNLQDRMSGLEQRMAHFEGTMDVLKDLFQASITNKSPS